MRYESLLKTESLLKKSNMETIIEQLPQELQRDIRNLNCLMEWGIEWLWLHSIEEKFKHIDALRHHIGDCVVTILLMEDDKKIQHFITHK